MVSLFVGVGGEDPLWGKVSGCETAGEWELWGEVGCDWISVGGWPGLWAVWEVVGLSP